MNIHSKNNTALSIKNKEISGLCCVILVLCFTFHFVKAADTSQEVKDIIDNVINDPSGKVNITNNEYKEKAKKDEIDSSQTTDGADSSQTNDSEKSAISLTSPGAREMVVNTNVKFSGKASSGVIVNIMVIDEDSERKFIRHQATSKLNGNVTADKKGEWVYVPQFDFIPGQYSVVASFMDNKAGTVQSDRIFFTIVDSSGDSSWSIFDKAWIIVLIIFISFVVLFFALLFFWKNKFFKARKKKNNFDFDLEPSVFGPSEEKVQTLRIIDYDSPGMEHKENLDDINEESLEVEKELIDVSRAVNESMQKIEKLKRDSLSGKIRGETKISEEDLASDINDVEKELIDVSKEVSEVVSKVEDMRESIVKKIKRKN